MFFQQTLPDTDVELPEVPGGEPEDRGKHCCLEQQGICCQPI